ncbi:lysophospholipid acyltransferase 6 isoform X2 [Topomyia yanbarensis]|uniref:lysophospholipid acyltransferase 6 isoform X2 n=1 Tax=Topomyia yanbarensis TaxID=2498891 RepID=UPI00273C54D7|nr:lysophospholipid acyltransferase 6 isoform X2 [Topomyia yanbarensis]XP_058832712.1 lysophospholipid acyltransferase 6 isoform X2 [Topomyia yanbarensis]XP_058832713.1 lysophospholipid acyltransferase 6 isoform X2 [Topomyia yanbarensis]XP_058832714.1 lysophospholipid acyltransferase 6 isoform X2 [Topomyia yanbarensis]
MQQIANIVGTNAYYDGSRVFTWLADLCGLSVDLVNFLITQFLALILASVFRSYLHPSKVTASTRHAIGLVIGLFFGYFCFGQQAIHIAGLPAVCYVVIRTQNPQIVQRTVMVVALAYLSCIHLHRQYYDYGSYSLDITGPLMIITQKVTSLAFSIHDGFTREISDLTDSQQQHAIRKLPSALEFFSYTLHFQGLMAGPLVFYKDYIDFIEGYHILKKTAVSNGKYDIDKKIVHEPSPVKAVVKKVVASLVCALIFIKFATIYPIKAMKDDGFMESTGFFYSFWYMMMATTAVRFKYYFAWLMSDAICNNSGLGFNGYEKDGVTPRWDMVSNIDVWAFEFGTNFRNCINSWNAGTNRWLRMVVFERVPKRYGTVLTFSLSALWHGFYPGYYITFATGAFIVMSARVARKLFRDRFQDTAFKRILYDVLTCLVTRVFMGYTTFPFVLLEFKASLRMYLNVFMCLHLVALITVFILTKLVPRGERKRLSPATTTVSITAAVANDRVTDSTRDYPNAMTIASDGFRLLAGHSVSVQNGTTSNGSATAIAAANGIHAESNEQPAAAAVAATSKTERESDNLSNLIKEKFEQETRNIEELIDKTVTGFVELKDDLMRMNENNEIFISAETLRKRQQSKAGVDLKNHSGSDHLGGGVDAFIKKEIDALNAAVQQANVLPAVLSNGHAK